MEEDIEDEKHEGRKERALTGLASRLTDTNAKIQRREKRPAH